MSSAGTAGSPARVRGGALLRAGWLTCLVLGGLLAISLIVAIGWTGDRLAVRLESGILYFSTAPGIRAAGFTTGWARPRFQWLFNAFPTALPGGLHWRGWIPLWMPLAACAGPTAILAWLAHRPKPSGRCQHCGYDLTGNVSGRCPECGCAA